MFRFVRVLLLWNIYVVFVEIFWLFEKYDFKLYGFFVEAIKKTTLLLSYLKDYLIFNNG